MLPVNAALKVLFDIALRTAVQLAQLLRSYRAFDVITSLVSLEHGVYTWKS
jgi:hypothetical protein